MNRRKPMAGMTNRPVRRPERLSDTVVAALRSDIESMRLAPGTKLPTEAELTRSFEVSRTVIREAVSRLKSDGVLTVRQGSGIYVTDPTEVDRAFRLGSSEQSNGASMLKEIFELRCGIEGESASLAAQRCSKADLRSFTSRFRNLERLTELQISKTGNISDAVAEADIQFHQAILKMARNNIMLRFNAFLASVFEDSVRSARSNSTSRDGYMQEALAEHRLIYEAIMRQDSDAAREAMRAHLISAQRRLSLNQSPGA